MTFTGRLLAGPRICEIYSATCHAAIRIAFTISFWSTHHGHRRTTADVYARPSSERIHGDLSHQHLSQGLERLECSSSRTVAFQPPGADMPAAKRLAEQPPRMSEDEKRLAREMHFGRGHTPQSIAVALGRHNATITRLLAQQRAPKPIGRPRSLGRVG